MFGHYLPQTGSWSQRKGTWQLTDLTPDQVLQTLGSTNRPALWERANDVLRCQLLVMISLAFLRICAAVEKVEQLWQQAFSKARLQLQVFQLREDALQVGLTGLLLPYNIDSLRSPSITVYCCFIAKSGLFDCRASVPQSLTVFPLYTFDELLCSEVTRS